LNLYVYVHQVKRIFYICVVQLNSYRTDHVYIFTIAYGLK